MFPNPYNVYLHSTPAQSLFERRPAPSVTAACASLIRWRWPNTCCATIRNGRVSASAGDGRRAAAAGQSARANPGVHRVRNRGRERAGSAVLPAGHLRSRRQARGTAAREPQSDERGRSCSQRGRAAAQVSRASCARGRYQDGRSRTWRSSRSRRAPGEAPHRTGVAYSRHPGARRWPCRPCAGYEPPRPS